MTRWMKALMVLSFVFVSPKSVAQEICATTPESFAAAKRAIAEIQLLSRANMIESNPSFSTLEAESRNMYTQFPPREHRLPWGTPATPHLFGQYGQAQTPSMSVKEPEEKRFSWWGYRHAELHSGGVIAELVDKSKPTNCCNGVWQGECRVTKYITDGVGARKILIDGLVCPIDKSTKIVQLNTFPEPDTVVLCANRTSLRNVDTPERSCPKTFCLGGGKLHM